MIKRLQNKIAESRVTLPVVACYAVAVWLAAGLVREQWWVQFGCFAVSTYLMVELNNSNALIRIYSRMVSSSFLVLSCMVGLFSSLQVAIAQLCFIASLITLFNTYQDKRAVGWTFYTFLLLSMASLVQVHVLYFVPVIWLLMVFNLVSMSWRSFFASLLGVLTPYWFAACYCVYQADFSGFVAHFLALGQFRFPYDYATVEPLHAAMLGFVVVLGVTGIVHYLRTSYNDKIRIRQLYSCFILLGFVAVVLLVLQPQHYDWLMCVIIVCTSPLIAHFLSLTYTRLTNIAFWLMSVVALALTVLNLWMPSLRF